MVGQRAGDPGQNRAAAVDDRITAFARHPAHPGDGLQEDELRTVGSESDARFHPEPGDQGSGRALGHDAALIDNGQAIAKLATVAPGIEAEHPNGWQLPALD
jgi:hypothetical protein